MKIVFLGIGSNLGDRERSIKKSLSMIEAQIGRVVEVSSIYETEPWGFQSNDNFLNIVLKLETELEPSVLMKRILIIESRLGRTRSDKQYTSRVIDIDILLYGDQIIDEVNLKVPHPFMPERKFVLIPFCELAPRMVHPILKTSFASLLEKCTDESSVRKFY